ncbi:MAG: phosphatase [Bacillota bacterium]
MNLVADLHTHTISSGHAYSTIAENLAEAAKKGLKLMAVTDHGPHMPGGPHLYYFGTMRVLPNKYMGIELLKGIEANIIDLEGSIDLPDIYYPMLDIVLAGFHTYCYPGGNIKENTRAMIKAMQNPLVDVIVHPGNPEFMVDPAEIVLAAKEYGILLEINNSSLGLSRAGSYGNCLKIAEKIAEAGIKVAVGSDAHWAGQVGDFSAALGLIAKAGIKEEQVINRSVEEIHAYLRRRRPEEKKKQLQTQGREELNI